MSSLTSSLHLTKPTVNGDAGVWPTELNNDMDYIDAGTNQSVTVSIPNTNISLVADGSSSDQSRYASYIFTGSLTADRTVTLPSNPKIGYATNLTTHNVILTAGGSTNLTLPPSTNSARVRFEVDGSNNVTSPPAGGVASLGTNSYTYMEGGGIFQIGFATTGSNGSVTVTFPKLFPNSCKFVFGDIFNSISFPLVAMKTSTPTAGSVTFTAVNTSTGATVASALGFVWIAWGF